MDKKKIATKKPTNLVGDGDVDDGLIDSLRESLRAIDRDELDKITGDDIDYEKLSERVQEDIKKKYAGNELFLVVVKKICYFLAIVGFTLEDACSMVGLNYDSFLELMKKDSLLGKLVVLMENKYKLFLMKSLNAKAKKGDIKTALMLLQTRFPHQYGKGASGDADNDDLGDVIRLIQKSKDADPLVDEALNKSEGIRKVDVSKILDKMQ
jgi:hypothetical protein